MVGTDQLGLRRWCGRRTALRRTTRCAPRRRGKTGDPLAPVTVLVPTQLCGVAARRALAHGVGERAGVAGLSVLTVDRLAERIAAPALVGSGRRPATGPVLAAAWRRALDEDPGVFGPVAGHRSTVRALAEAHRELREVDAAALDVIAGSREPIAVDLVRLHRRVVTLLAADWYDTKDLRETATATLRRRASAGRRDRRGGAVPSAGSSARRRWRCCSSLPRSATCTRSPD